MKFGYVMKEGKPIRIIHGSSVITYDSAGGRHEFPVKFVEAESWPEAVGKIVDESNESHYLNMAAIREAFAAINCIDTRRLKYLLCELVEADIPDGGQINKTISAIEKARRALAAPPRNCDVGTAAEQNERFWEYCNAHSCNECPARGGWRTVIVDGTSVRIIQCGVLWAQMPYESEVKNQGVANDRLH